MPAFPPPPRLKPGTLLRRSTAPELLDELPPEHPAVLDSRRDLRRINHLMRNPSWIAGQIQSVPKALLDIAEIGAGEASLAEYCLQANPAIRSWTAFDRHPVPSEHPKISARKEDLLESDGPYEAPVLVGSLIFHHFDDEALAMIGRKIATGKTRMIIASEPARARVPLLFMRLGWIWRFHAITRHDGVVSIGAGFRGEELPKLLALPAADWRWECNLHWLGAYRMVAVRRVPGH